MFAAFLNKCPAFDSEASMLDTTLPPSLEDTVVPVTPSPEDTPRTADRFLYVNEDDLDNFIPDILSDRPVEKIWEKIIDSEEPFLLDEREIFA